MVFILGGRAKSGVLKIMRRGASLLVGWSSFWKGSNRPLRNRSSALSLYFKIKGAFKPLIPSALLPRVRNLTYSLEDFVEWFLGRSDPLLPPRRLRYPEIYEFKELGERTFHQLITWGGLKPTDRILDVGCGIGRVARPLTRYLKPPGSYEGFDIVDYAIRWCHRHITPRYPHFRFQGVGVYNSIYNPNGKLKASEFRFPYEDESFDFVVLNSVFTHMLPTALEHYLSEITRTLKSGSSCQISYFLLNPESLELMAKKLSDFDFKHPVGDSRTTHPFTPEGAIAHDENYIRCLYQKFGLDIREPLRCGVWCGRQIPDASPFKPYQDVIIAVKNKPISAGSS